MIYILCQIEPFRARSVIAHADITTLSGLFSNVWNGCSAPLTLYSSPFYVVNSENTIYLKNYHKAGLKLHFFWQFQLNIIW